MRDAVSIRPCDGQDGFSAAEALGRNCKFLQAGDYTVKYIDWDWIVNDVGTKK